MLIPRVEFTGILCNDSMLLPKNSRLPSVINGIPINIIDKAMAPLRKTTCRLNMNLCNALCWVAEPLVSAAGKS